MCVLCVLCVCYNSLTSDVFQIILAICLTTHIRIIISLMSSTASPIKLSDHVAVDDLSSLAEMIDFMFAEMIRLKQFDRTYCTWH